jgi:hypothetical protein
LDIVGGIALGWVQQVIGGAPNYPNYGVIVGLELPDALFRQAPDYGHGPQQFYKDDDDTFYEEDNSLPDGWDYET